MMATDRAASRDSDQWTDCANQRPDHGRTASSGANSSGTMAQQSSPGCEAAPPTFVRLTGSHLVKPRAPRQD
ncbi:hypothetical protein [Bradyrhizobium neotropicale]|uniref:Uncharacterized protein n=1 Tax=Bradyrhizobium neotropicale TaxID=1497615 RepID=A0A176ZE22_9BRAD|nr:hypothetical protein [Bradyrhizobium neotropicale]OAF18454.1 hypothetical protein AXW67_04550 [Bradyrhizobium neotropicale]